MHTAAWLPIPFTSNIELTCFLHTSVNIIYTGQTNELLITHTHILWIENMWHIHDNDKMACVFVCVCVHVHHTFSDTQQDPLPAPWSSVVILVPRSCVTMTSRIQKPPPPRHCLSETQTLIHGYTPHLVTRSPALQRRFDSCGAACQRCHADRKLLTRRSV